MTSCAGGTCTVRNTLPSGVSSIPLLPLRMCFSINACSGSPATSAALTSRCSPLATSVTTTAARRAARSAFNACRTSSFTSAYFLHINADGATAGQADLPGRFICDAEFEHLRFAALDHVHRFGHHGALDAAAGYGSEEVTVVVNDEVRADRSRRRAPCLDHRCKRNLAPVFPPFFGS